MNTRLWATRIATCGLIFSLSGWAVAQDQPGAKPKAGKPPAVKPAADPGAKPAEPGAKPAGAKPEGEKPAGGAFSRGEKLPKSLAELLDQDGDGKVSDQEAQKAAAEVQKKGNAKTDDGKEVRAALDANGDGKIDAQEAKQAVARGRVEADERAKNVAKFFDALDADGNGSVSVPEFRALIEKLGPVGKLIEPRLGEFFLRVDQDRNGQIDPTEAQMASEFIAQQTVAKEQADQAEQEGQKLAMARQVIATMDQNRDGKLGFREVKGPLAQQFNLIDANGDKTITPLELADAFAKLQTGDMKLPELPKFPKKLPR